MGFDEVNQDLLRKNCKGSQLPHTPPSDPKDDAGLGFLSPRKDGLTKRAQLELGTLGAINAYNPPT